MKKIFTLITLALVALLGGASSAKAETTTLYERGTTQDNAWTADDVTAWGADDFNATTGLHKTGGNGSNAATLTINPTKNSIIDIEAYWIGMSNTGRTLAEGNCSYFNYAGVFVEENDQNKASAYSVNGFSSTNYTTFTSPTGRANRAYDATTGAWYVVKMQINTATNKLVSLTVESSDKLGTKLVDLSDVTLTNPDYTKVVFGYIKTGGVKTTNNEYLKSIKITQTTQSVATADYTINYIFDGTKIKTVDGNTTVNSTVNAESPITIEGQKYYATSGTSLTISSNAEDNVLDVTLRKANLCTYTLKSSVDNAVVGTGSATEGETVYVGYPAFILSGNTLYSSARTGSEYRKSKNLTENTEEVITYTATDKTNVIYYSEAENIEGLTATNAGNVAARCSGAFGAYATAQTKITTLTPGKYIVSGFAWGNTGTTFSLTVNGDKVAEFGSVASTVSVSSGSEFVVASNTDLMVEIAGNAGNSPKVLDLVYVQKTGDYYTETITTNEKGLTTYVTTGALDFTDVEGLEAYVASDLTAEKVTLTKVNKVKAGEAIVVKGEASTNYTVPALAGAADTYINKFVGAAEATEARTAGSTIFALSKANGDFRIVGDAVKELPEGKAYLALTSAGAKTAISLAFGDDNATAANEVVADDNNAVNGKFVENGKIVIKKGGKKYNAAAIEVK